MDQFNLKPVVLIILIGLSVGLNAQNVELIEKASQGDPEAQWVLSYFYIDKYFSDSSDVNDLKKCFNWAKKSAEQGYEKAQFMLATLYLNGTGTKQDENLAATWYFKSFQQGNSDSEFQLAKIYLEDSTNENNSYGGYLLWESAENGSAAAQYYFATNFASDIIQWYEYTRKSAEQGYAPAEYEIGVCYKIGRLLEENQDTAKYWIERSAKQGYSMAQYVMGNILREDTRIESNERLSAYYYLESAKQGYPAAQLNLGICYYNGTGLLTNKKKSAYWIRQAWINGEERAKKVWDELELWKYE